MFKRKENRIGTRSGMELYNQVSPATNFVFCAIALIFGLMCIIPVFLVIGVSFTSQEELARYGYHFIPKQIDTLAYKFIFNSSSLIVKAFFNSVFVTVVGVLFTLFFTSTIAYALSRPNFYFKKLFTIIITITMLFGGGMIASYSVISDVLRLRDSYLSLILPMALGAFNIIIMRTFFQTTVPHGIIESAQIDGASQLTIFTRIVLPISKPVLATIGMFSAFAYWNDWYLASLYIRTQSKFPLQYLLMQIQRTKDFLVAQKNNSVAMQTSVQIPSEAINMAIVVVAVVPIACTYPFFQKYFISGLTIGAIKG